MAQQNDQLVAIQAEHSRYIQRLAAGLGNDSDPYIDSMQQRITDRINRENGKNLTPLRRENLLSDINDIVNEELSAYTKELAKGDLDVGVYEVGFQAKAITDVFPTVEATATVSRSVIKTQANNTLIKLGEGSYTSYNQMLKQYTATNAEQITNIVGNGFVSGVSTREIINEVLSEVDNRIVKTRKQARGIARTGTTHYANQARRAYFEEEPVVIGTQNISVMDSATSDFCRGIDLRITLKTDPNYSKAFAPFHNFCRGSNSPVVDSRYAHNDESGQRPENFRYADSGLLDPKTTSSKKIYYDAFKNLDAKSQDLVLGKTLGKAFRAGLKDGTLTPESFAKLTIDEKNLTGLSLKEVIQKDNALSRILIKQNKGKNNYLGREIEKANL